MKHAFFEKGWCRFPHDPTLAAWVSHALPVARDAVAEPEHAQWLRCGGTWFAGVNVLPNNASGAVGVGPVLAGQAVDFIFRYSWAHRIFLGQGTGFGLLSRLSEAHAVRNRGRIPLSP